MKRVVILVSLCFLIILLLLTSCGGQEIKVGSKQDPESILLAQMIILILSENGYKVVDMTPSGSTEDTWRALLNKDIDICLEYTANYERLRDYKDNLEKTGGINDNSMIVWLKPAPADNKWGIAISRSLSEEIKDKISKEKKEGRPKTINDLPEITGKTMSEFAFYVNHSPVKDIKLICSPEFITNPEALPKFQEAYSFELKPKQLEIFPSSNTAYLAEMAETNNNINAFMVYTTDGHLEEHDLVLLEDDLKVQSIFHPAPIMLKTFYDERFKDEDDKDKINRILTPLFASLDDETLRKLNSKTGSQAISEVARQYLIENGFFKYNEFQMVQNAMEELRISKNGTIDAFSEEASAKEGTSDMSVFPNVENKLYIAADNVTAYEISENTTWSYITWSETIGKYRCNNPSGNVTQIETGWD